MSNDRKLWWQDMPERYDETTVSQVTVFPLEPQPTGLLDADGNKIMRSPHPLGFLNRAEEA